MGAIIDTKFLVRFFIASALAGSVVLAGHAIGQEPEPLNRTRSHNLEFLEGSSLEASELAQRLGIAKESSDAQDLYRQIMKNPAKYLQPENRQALERIAESIKNGRLKLDADDPMIKEMRRRFEAGSGLENLPPEYRRIVKEYQEKVAQQQDGVPGSGSPEGTTGASSTPAPVAPPAITRPGDAGTGGEGPGRSSERSSLERWVIRQAENMASRSDLLNNSSAFRKALDELSQSSQGMSEGSGAGPGSKLADIFPKNLLPARIWAKVDWPDWRKLRVPGWESFSLPDLRWPERSESHQDPGLTEFIAPSTGTVGIVLFGSAIAAFVFFAGSRVWQRFGTIRWRPRAIPFAGKDRELGPWPLAPATVTTREDVIRAFEYLSLLRLGSAARSWNHLDIAGKLGGGDANRRRLADELAWLYERARYAPAGQLPEDALAAARKGLSLLAGVSAG